VGEGGSALLFLGSGGSRLTPNAVGMRFSRALRAASLNRPGMSWDCWACSSPPSRRFFS
jgi:hypothetical protein